MVQRYLPAIQEGDKRILMVNGSGTLVSGSSPLAGESRGNAAGGSGIVQPLTERDTGLPITLGLSSGSAVSTLLASM